MPGGRRPAPKPRAAKKDSRVVYVRFGKTGTPVPIPKAVYDRSKAEGLRLNEDGTLENPGRSRREQGPFVSTAKLDPSQVHDRRGIPLTAAQLAGPRIGEAPPKKPKATPGPSPQPAPPPSRARRSYPKPPKRSARRSSAA